MTTELRLRGRVFTPDRPAVMAIINRTTNSFFAGNRYHQLDDALLALDYAVASGADLVDVGGVRAGQEGPEITPVAEYDAVAPFLEAARARHPDLILSVDTWRSEVAERLRWAEVDLINDTWAGYDHDLMHVAAAHGQGYVCSHSGGLAPRTDPVAPHYPPEPDGVVDDVCTWLSHLAHRAVEAGVAPERVLVDPTLDFGKHTLHSLTLLRHTDRVASLGFPVLQAISRKDFIGETLNLPVEERLEGSLAAVSIASWLGCTVFRVHDVQATRRALDMVASIKGVRAPLVFERGNPNRA